MPWTKKGFLEALHQENSFYYVAKIDEEIVGYCGAYAIYDEGDINQVAVMRQYRRCGIAKKLVSRMMEDLDKAGYHVVTLEVRMSNEPAITLYKSMGFVNEGVRKNFYERPTEDAMIMWKR